MDRSQEVKRINTSFRRGTALGLLFVLFALAGCDHEPDGCEGSISWQEAESHIGDEVTVEGPVVRTRYASETRGRPTFLDIGKRFPDPKRLGVVIWEENRDEFSPPPEDVFDGETICVSGIVDSFEGVPQIEVSRPDQITIP